MTDNKSLFLKSFNKQYFDFLEDIISIVPDNIDIQTALKYFETIKRANPTILIKLWYSKVYIPYHIEIELGNIDFFLEKDYNDDLTSLPNGKEISKIIDNSIRYPIKNMNEVNKSHCVKYLQILCKLSFMYHC
jgi:hypothetical protein